jgi:hypothetical protein
MPHGMAGAHAMPEEALMTNPAFDRRDRFTPTPRPAWLSTLNGIGEGLDLKGIVPLSAESLLGQAIANTGLSDFGDGDFREPLTVLTKAIDDEGELHFGGRLYTRGQFLFFLESRLRTVDWFRRHPETDEEVIDKPVLITGFGRSGTTILFEVLSLDPRFRVVQKWEGLLPAPPPEPDTYSTDPRIAKTERLTRLLDEMIPEFSAVHKMGGTLPIESLELEYPTFLSEVFPMMMHVPSYAAYIRGKDLTSTFAWHRKTLKLLQSRYKRDHWLMKSPSHLPHLERYLGVFPGMRVIFAHRDPIVTADSVTSFLGMLYYQRTDKVWGSGEIESWVLAMGEERAKLWDPVIAMIQSGRMAKGSYANFHYHRFVSDPIGAVQSVYDDLGMTLTGEVAQSMRNYLAKKTKGLFGKHEYEPTSANSAESERSAYAAYQRFFSVPNEV